MSPNSRALRGPAGDRDCTAVSVAGCSGGHRETSAAGQVDQSLAAHLAGEFRQLLLRQFDVPQPRRPEGFELPPQSPAGRRGKMPNDAVDQVPVRAGHRQQDRRRSAAANTPASAASSRRTKSSNSVSCVASPGSAAQAVERSACCRRREKGLTAAPLAPAGCRGPPGAAGGGPTARSTASPGGRGPQGCRASAKSWRTSGAAASRCSRRSQDLGLPHRRERCSRSAALGMAIAPEPDRSSARVRAPGRGPSGRSRHRPAASRARPRAPPDSGAGQPFRMGDGPRPAVVHRRPHEPPAGTHRPARGRRWSGIRREFRGRDLQDDRGRAAWVPPVGARRPSSPPGTRRGSARAPGARPRPASARPWYPRGQFQRQLGEQDVRRGLVEAVEQDRRLTNPVV